MRSTSRFAADATLGKLGRYLRSAGFDTLCQHESRHGDFFGSIDDARVILTRTMRLKWRFKNRPLIFIRDNEPVEQMLQVVRELNLTAGDVNPFSRCLMCNAVIFQVDREAVRGRVPAYVWQRHHTFSQCGKCGRIYWAGSHHDRMVKRLVAIFQEKDEDTHAC
jgi:uncharacterized protein with PIN domain